MIRTALVHAIRPATEQRFNLAWAYGSFLNLVPQRLGRSEALDSSVLALTQAHTDFCLRRSVSVTTTISYGKALRKLRATLNDPETAQAAGTLCAIVLLLQAQVTLTYPNPQSIADTSIYALFGSSEYRTTNGHIVGMAQLLKQRGIRCNPNDPFESTLVAFYRETVAFSAIYMPGIELTDVQWKCLVESSNGECGRPEEYMMQCPGLHFSSCVEEECCKAILWIQRWSRKSTASIRSYGQAATLWTQTFSLSKEGFLRDIHKWHCYC